MSDGLKFLHEDNGFCRVMFVREVEGHKYLYCWQLDGPGFTFYRCSGDGEPSHEVRGWGGVSALAMTPRNPEQTEIGRQLNTFLEKVNEPANLD